MISIKFASVLAFHPPVLIFEEFSGGDKDVDFVHPSPPIKKAKAITQPIITMTPKKMPMIVTISNIFTLPFLDQLVRRRLDRSLAPR